MNSPEITDYDKQKQQEELEAYKRGEIAPMVSGTTIEQAFNDLERLYPGYDLTNKSLRDLEDEEWSQIRQSELATNHAEAKNFLAKANAIRRIMVTARPNNTIREIVKDDRGNFVGFKIELKELENQGGNQAEDLPKAA